MRKIDAERLDCVVYKGIPEGFDDRFDDGVMWMLEQIDKSPTVEPEIVRCKDCIYQRKGENEIEIWNLCIHNPLQYRNIDDDHYCGYAERRIDEQN